MLQYFISDLHLDATGEPLLGALTDFLVEEAAGADELYILGDLFEAWLGDDDETEIGALVAARLLALARAGTRILLMHGNRDFLLGEDFARRAGARLLTGDLHRIQCGEETVLIMHGDTLCTRDEAYLRARKLLRSPEFQRDFLAKSLAERAAFAREARSASLAHTGGSQPDILDVTPEEVDRVMREAGVRLLIHGHTHRPNIHRVLDGTGHRFVLGDWGRDGWYLKARDEKLELVSFPISEVPPEEALAPLEQPAK